MVIVWASILKRVIHDFLFIYFVYHIWITLNNSTLMFCFVQFHLKFCILDKLLQHEHHTWINCPLQVKNYLMISKEKVRHFPPSLFLLYLCLNYFFFCWTFLFFFIYLFLFICIAHIVNWEATSYHSLCSLSIIWKFLIRWTT